MRRQLRISGKLIGLLFTLALVLAVPAQLSPATHVKASDTGLLVYYAFDEGQGVVLHDRSGHGLDGAIHGASWIEGPSGTALSFDGDGDYTQTDGYFPFSGSNEMTIEAWVRLTGHSGWDGVISSYSDCIYRLMILPDLHPYYDPGTPIGGRSIPTFTFKVGPWYHYAMTIQGGQARVFVNGTLISESPQGVPSLLPDVSDAFVLGTGEMNTPYIHWLQGMMDEVRIYNRALTDDEIRADMMSSPPIPTVQLEAVSFNVNEDAGVAPITVTLSMALPTTVTVDYRTMDATAVAGRDYQSSTGALVFTPGTMMRPVEIPIFDNLIVEGDRTFILALSTPVGAAMGTPNLALITILDNDFTLPGSLVINGGALDSTTRTVQLGFTGLDAASVIRGMSFSNDGSIWSAWQPYASSANWMLSEDEGQKTVYARFRDNRGFHSIPMSSTIRLDTTAGTEYAVTINDGALFTNQPAVTLTIGARQETAQMQVSNDGGFAGASWEPYTTHKAWGITQFGSYVIPRFVYVRFKDILGNASATVLDDVILDVTPPTGSVQISMPVSYSTGSISKLTGSMDVVASTALTYHIYLPVLTRNYCVDGICATLLLSANDDVSGVGDMLVSGAPDFHEADWQPFSPQLRWVFALRGDATVYVKFRDNAGNVSNVYSASLENTMLPGGIP